MEAYEELLEKGMKDVKPSECCGRFEIKQVEGHHEGVRTVVSNFVAVAGCLRREPEHLAKFLFKELAAPGEIVSERLILVKKVSSQAINDKIEKYVKKYVLCPSCGKPDTELVEDDGEFIRCLACGHKQRV